jgi:hypothetical protein
MKEDLPGESGKELQIPVSIEKKVSDGSTSSNSPKNNTPPGGGSVKKAESKNFSIEHLPPTES